jgi:UPF0176 protein
METPDDRSSNNVGEQPALFSILALYHFPSPKLTEERVDTLRDEIEVFLLSHHARGTIVLATEGINGTICYPKNNNDNNDSVVSFFSELFPQLQTRLSFHKEHVFYRLKVRIKPEIVTMGVAVGVVPPAANTHATTTTGVGTYVNAGPDWDRLIADPECLVIDARNEYEIQVGTFRGAVNPHTRAFVEFPEWIRQQLVLNELMLVEDEKQQHPEREAVQTTAAPVKNPKFNKLAFFCTGGIRCEKATAYCLDLLQTNKTTNNSIADDDKNEIQVYHLKGGILAYLDQVSQDRSTFEGECYVFDHRTAVQHGLRASDKYTICHACRHPLTVEDRQKNNADYYQLGICCQYCISDEYRLERRQRYESRQKQFEICEKEGVPHVHDAKEKLFNGPEIVTRQY